MSRSFKDAMDALIDDIKYHISKPASTIHREERPSKYKYENVNIFRASCVEGDMNQALHIYRDGHVTLDGTNVSIFRSICLNDDWKMANWIYPLYEPGAISDEYFNIIFNLVCTNGYTQTAIWMNSRRPLCLNMMGALFSACKNDQLETAQWLYSRLSGEDICLRCLTDRLYKVCSSNTVHKEVLDSIKHVNKVEHIPQIADALLKYNNHTKMIDWLKEISSRR